MVSVFWEGDFKKKDVKLWPQSTPRGSWYTSNQIQIYTTWDWFHTSFSLSGKLVFAREDFERFFSTDLFLCNDYELELTQHNISLLIHVNYYKCTKKIYITLHILNITPSADFKRIACKSAFSPILYEEIPKRELLAASTTCALDTPTGGPLQSTTESRDPTFKTTRYFGCPASLLTYEIISSLTVEKIIFLFVNDGSCLIFARLL